VTTRSFLTAAAAPAFLFVDQVRRSVQGGAPNIADLDNDAMSDRFTVHDADASLLRDRSSVDPPAVPGPHRAALNVLLP
jgi:hypothetical protein